MARYRAKYPERSRAYLREYRARNPEKARVWAQTKRQRHGEKIKARFKAINLFRRYGITQQDYNTMLVAQSGACAICAKACPTGKRLAVDHDHLSGKVRGLLCASCNARINTLAFDGTGLFIVALRYLGMEVAA